MKKVDYLLILLLFFSFFIRIFRLNSLPLFGDEIDVGYQAFSLLNTAHDYRGYFLPFYTESLSESRAPLLIYLTIPFVKIFGLNLWAARLPPLIFGVLSIFLLYKLVFLLSKSEKLSLLSAAVFSLLPWHYLYSRAAFEVTLLVSLIIAAVYFFYLFINKTKTTFLFISIFLFALSFYTYNTANIFVPLLVLYLLLSHLNFLRKKLPLKPFLAALFFSLLLITPLLREIFWGKAAERISLISIFKSSQLTDTIVNKRTSFSALPPETERFFHNKPETIGKSFLHNLVNSFSLNFLFFGDLQNNPRHSLPGFGLLFLSFLPPLLVGLWRIDKNNQVHRFFLYWLFISALPAAITLGGGTHPTRLFLMSVPLAFFTAYGFSLLILFKIVKLILLVSLVWEITSFAHEYFIHYPKDSARLWNYGYDETFTGLSQIKFNRLFISNTNYNSLLPYLFYNQVSPASIALDDHEKANIYSDLPGFKISDTVFFINNWQHHHEIFQKINQLALPGDVFVLFQLNEIPGDMDLLKTPIDAFKTLKAVYNPDGSLLSQVIQKQ